MHERKSIKKSVRFNVFKRDNFTCQYCGKSAPDVELEIDHILPVSKGGGNNIDNLVTSCKQCNRSKSNQVFSFNPKAKNIKELFYKFLNLQKSEDFDRYDYLSRLDPQLRYFFITLERLYVLHGEKHLYGFIQQLYSYYEDYTLEAFSRVLKSDILLEPLLPVDAKYILLERADIFTNTEYQGRYEFLAEVWSLITDDFRYILNGSFQTAFELYFESNIAAYVGLDKIKMIAFESKSPESFVSELEKLIKKE